MASLILKFDSFWINQMLNHALIVEDDEVTLFLTQTIIRRSKIVEKIEVAKDGQEALQFLRKHNTDVVFLDISLPVMTGFELLEACQRDSSITTTFVILSSTDREAELAREGNYPQVLMHLEKPLSPEDLELVKQAVIARQKNT